MEPGLAGFLGLLFGGALGGSVRAMICARIKEGAGVFLVNVSGGFLLGLFAARIGPESTLWAFAATGFLGAYTTVSGFALGTVQLWLQGAKIRASGAVLVTLGATVAAVAFGIWLGTA